MRRMTRTVVATMAISILAACQTEPATVERTSEVTATVTAIDLPGRLVTLRGPEGNLFTVQAHEDVQESAAARGRRSRGGPLLPGDRRRAMAGPGGQCERDGDARAARREARAELAQEVTAMVKITTWTSQATRSRSPTPTGSRRPSPCRTPRCGISSRPSRSATRSRSPTPRRSRSCRAGQPVTGAAEHRQDHRRRDQTTGIPPTARSSTSGAGPPAADGRRDPVAARDLSACVLRLMP